MNKFNMIRILLFLMVLCLYAVILNELSSSEVFASELKPEKASVKMTPEAYLEQYLEAFNNQDEEAAYRLWIHGANTEIARKSYAELFSKHLKIWGTKKHIRILGAGKNIDLQKEKDRLEFYTPIKLSVQRRYFRLNYQLMIITMECLG